MVEGFLGIVNDIQQLFSQNVPIFGRLLNMPLLLYDNKNISKASFKEQSTILLRC